MNLFLLALVVVFILWVATKPSNNTSSSSLVTTASPLPPAKGNAVLSPSPSGGSYLSSDLFLRHGVYYLFLSLNGHICTLDKENTFASYAFPGSPPPPTRLPLTNGSNPYVDEGTYLVLDLTKLAGATVNLMVNGTNLINGQSVHGVNQYIVI